MPAPKTQSVNQTAQPTRPSCMCFDIKTALFIWIGISLISQLASAFALKGILMGAYIIGALFSLVGVVGTSKENSIMLKVFFWSEIMYMFANAAFQIVFINLNVFKEGVLEACAAYNAADTTTSKFNCGEVLNSTMTNSYIGLAVGMIVPIIVLVQVRKFYNYIDNRDSTPNFPRI